MDTSLLSQKTQETLDTRPGHQPPAAKQLLWIALIPAVGMGYYFGIALPENNAARLTLERQKYEDQKAADTSRIEDARAKAEKRESDLSQCLLDAEGEYLSYVKLNGTETKDGNLRAPVTVFAAADKRKTEAHDVCLKRFPPER